jgi:hypothetical protein
MERSQVLEFIIMRLNAHGITICGRVAQLFALRPKYVDGRTHLLEILGSAEEIDFIITDTATHDNLRETFSDCLEIRRRQMGESWFCTNLTPSKVIFHFKVEKPENIKTDSPILSSFLRLEHKGANPWLRSTTPHHSTESIITSIKADLIGKIVDIITGKSGGMIYGDPSVGCIRAAFPTRESYDKFLGLINGTYGHHTSRADVRFFTRAISLESIPTFLSIDDYVESVPKPVLSTDLLITFHDCKSTLDISDVSTPYTIVGHPTVEVLIRQMERKRAFVIDLSKIEENKFHIQRHKDAGYTILAYHLEVKEC